MQEVLHGYALVKRKGGCKMNQYVFVVNEQGERITSFVDNMISKDELLD